MFKESWANLHGDCSDGWHVCTKYHDHMHYYVGNCHGDGSDGRHVCTKSNYTFIACTVFYLEKHMSPHYNVLPCKPRCLQTCNYDQSLVGTDTNKNSSFDITSFFELLVSNDAHHSPIDLR